MCEFVGKEFDDFQVHPGTSVHERGEVDGNLPRWIALVSERNSKVSAWQAILDS